MKTLMLTLIHQTEEEIFPIHEIIPLFLTGDVIRAFEIFGETVFLAISRRFHEIARDDNSKTIAAMQGKIPHSANHTNRSSCI